MEPRHRLVPLLAAAVVGLAGSATASTPKLHGSNFWSNCRFSHTANDDPIVVPRRGPAAALCQDLHRPLIAAGLQGRPWKQASTSRTSARSSHALKKSACAEKRPPEASVTPFPDTSG